MSDPEAVDPDGAEAHYLRAVLAASTLAAEALLAMEAAAEALAPERSAGLAADIGGRYEPPLAAAERALAAAPPPPELAPFDAMFAPAFRDVVACVTGFAGFPAAPPPSRIPHILTALHHHARAQEGFFAIRELLPPFRRYWALPDAPAEAEPAAPDVRAERPRALVHVSAGGRHGGFSVLAPAAGGDAPLPVIVALHGGSGNGRDFLWSWAREARSRGYLLVAPTAVGSTWSEVDELGLLEILAWLGTRWTIDPARVLLTGLSDGGTFTLLYGLAHPDVFRALAPACGVLHPWNLANGNMIRARNVPVYLVHGALDFLFPVPLAHLTRDALTEAGAALTYREIAELSHAHPRSENARILEWFEALPPRG